MGITGGDAIGLVIIVLLSIVIVNILFPIKGSGFWKPRIVEQDTSTSAATEAAGVTAAGATAAGAPAAVTATSGAAAAGAPASGAVAKESFTEPTKRNAYGVKYLSPFSLDWTNTAGGV